MTGGGEGQVTVGHSVGAAVVGQTGGGWQVGHEIGGKEGHATVGQVGGGGYVTVGQVGRGGHVVVGGHVGGSGFVYNETYIRKFLAAIVMNTL